MDTSPFNVEVYRKYPVPSGFGREVPLDDKHALGVSLPTWKQAIGWARGDSEVLDELNWGYPRSFTHPYIRLLSGSLIVPPQAGYRVLYFSHVAAALRCRKFIGRCSELELTKPIHIRTLYPTCVSKKDLEASWSCITVLRCTNYSYSLAKKFWERTGEGISSRQAKLCLELQNQERGPVVYIPIFEHLGGIDFTPGKWQNALHVARHHMSVVIRTRFYRDKNLIKARVSRLLGVPPTDVFLYPSGTKAIYDVYRAIRSLFHVQVQRTIAFGVNSDTINTISLFGTATYGATLRRSAEGTKADLDTLEAELMRGSEYLVLFCEVPGGPFLRTPDLKRIRRLANKYGFVVVCDDTLGTSVNIDLLPYADIIVTSLGKLFSGQCNVMGGTATINPRSKYHDWLHERLTRKFVDTYHPHDAHVMALNSEHFIQRVRTTNQNAMHLAKYIRRIPGIKVYYPFVNSTKALYNDCRRAKGQYGNVMSIKFEVQKDAINFYNALHIAKGPMLGTNFSLAFAQEQKNKKGVLEYLTRLSVGLEDWREGKVIIDKALMETHRTRIQRRRMQRAVAEQRREKEELRRAMDELLQIREEHAIVTALAQMEMGNFIVTDEIEMN